MRRDENEWIVFDVLLFMTGFTIFWQHRELNPKAKDLSLEITVNSFKEYYSYSCRFSRKYW